jgi:protoporphyrin/coproporphyrin ferrochelatase
MNASATARPVLLITMGGPRSLAEVKPYLRRLFADPYIIPGGPLKRWLLSRIIARAAAPKSRARYALIGGRSNAVEDTEHLARSVTEAFAARGLAVRCAVATRYSTPDIREGLAALVSPSPRPESVTPVYLFPHETSAMTGSCAEVLQHAARQHGVTVTHGLRRLGMTEVYVQGWARAITAAVREPAATFVLFGCHSLPLSIVQRGDPYVGEVERSVARIQARLGDLAGGLAYQSQEAADWLGPTVDQKAAEAYAQGFRELIIVPLSFTAENTETLVDLDRDLREAARALGFRRIERLSTPDKLGFLTAMVVEGLHKEWGLEQ